MKQYDHRVGGGYMIDKNSLAIKKGNFQQGKPQNHKVKNVYHIVSTATCEVMIDGIKCLKKRIVNTTT